MSATPAASIRQAVSAYCNKDDAADMRQFARFNEPLNEAMHKLAALRAELETLEQKLNDPDDRVAWTALRSFVDHVGYSNTPLTMLVEFQCALAQAQALALEIAR